MASFRNFLKVILRLTEVLFIVLIVFAAFNFRLVVYGVYQLKGQLAILYNAKPIEDFISDDSFPDSLKTKLLLIDEVKRFAIDSLGLKETKNYSTLYDQKGKPLLMNLTAAERF